MAGASATKTRLFIPTPAGAVEILSLTVKAGTDRSRSAVLKRQSYEPLGLSARYRQFVSDTGPLGLAGPVPDGRVYILQLSADIDGGDSWNLPVLLFHLIDADHDCLGAVSRTGSAVTIFATGSLAFDPRLSLREQPLKAERYALEEKMKTWLKAAAPFSGKVLVLLPADAEADDLDRAEALARYALAGLASVVRCRTVGDAMDALAALAGSRKPAERPVAGEPARPDPPAVEPAETPRADPEPAKRTGADSQPVVLVPAAGASIPAAAIAGAPLIPPLSTPPVLEESRSRLQPPSRGQAGALSGSAPLAESRPSRPAGPADRRSPTRQLAAVGALVAMLALGGVLAWRIMVPGEPEVVAADPEETATTGTTGEAETPDAGDTQIGADRPATAEANSDTASPAPPGGSAGPTADEADTAGGTAPPPAGSSSDASAESEGAFPPSPGSAVPATTGNAVAVEALLAPDGTDCAPLVFGTARPETVLLPAAGSGPTFTVELPAGTCGITLTFPEAWTVEWSADLAARRMSGLGGLVREGGKASARILAKGASGFSGRTLTLEPPAAGVPGTPTLRVR